MNDENTGGPGRRERDEGLGLLLADVLKSDELEHQTLLRYAEDPGALAAEDRLAFEARLAEDPGLRDRLAVLRRFDPSDTAADPSEDDGVVVAMAARTRRAWMPWVGLAAAAGLASVIVLPRLGQDATPDSSSSTLPVAAVQVPSHGDAEEISEALVVSPAPPASAPASSEVVALERGPEVAAVETAVAREVAVAEPADPVVEEPAREEILLAAHFEAAQYRPPADLLGRVAVGAVVRGSTSGPALVAWVPDHVAHSATPQPTLYWSLEGDGATEHEIGLVVTSESASEPLYEGAQAVDASGTWQHSDLAALGVALQSGEIYRWSVFVRTAEGAPAVDRIAQGWIEYREPSKDQRSALATATAGSRAARYAEQGYWYDALALLADFASEHPDDPDARDRLEGFLEAAGVATAMR